MHTQAHHAITHVFTPHFYTSSATFLTFGSHSGLYLLKVSCLPLPMLTVKFNRLVIAPYIVAPRAATRAADDLRRFSRRFAPVVTTKALATILQSKVLGGAAQTLARRRHLVPHGTADTAYLPWEGAVRCIFDWANLKDDASAAVAKGV